MKFNLNRRRRNLRSVYSITKSIIFFHLKEISCSMLSHTNPDSCFWPCFSNNSERYKGMKNLYKTVLMDIKMTEGEVKSVGFKGY